MSSWSPNDLVTDVDLLGYEPKILESFGVMDWQAARRKAIQDWLFPLLEARKFDPLKLRTRHLPIQAASTTSAVTTDRTAAAATENGLNLATILASASDSLYIGFSQPFFGVSVRMLDSVSSVDSKLSVACWVGNWDAPEGVEDGTRVGLKTFARGGAITWQLPDALVTRVLNSQGPAYWCRLQVTASPTGALAGPWLVIRKSRLCAPVTFRTLAQIYRAAPVGQDGPWDAKAEFYEAEASRAFQRVMDNIGGEFDTNADDAIDETERAQTASEVSGGGLSLERY